MHLAHMLTSHPAVPVLPMASPSPPRPNINQFNISSLRRVHAALNLDFAGSGVHSMVNICLCHLVYEAGIMP